MQPLNISGLHLWPVGGCLCPYICMAICERKETRVCTCNLSIVCSEFYSQTGPPLATSSPLGPDHRAGCDQRERTFRNASLAQHQQRSLAAHTPLASAAFASKGVLGLSTSAFPGATKQRARWFQCFLLGCQDNDPAALAGWRLHPSLSQPASPWELKAVTKTMAPMPGHQPTGDLEKLIPLLQAVAIRQAVVLCSAPEVLPVCLVSRQTSRTWCPSLKHFAASRSTLGANARVSVCPPRCWACLRAASVTCCPGRSHGAS